ncbi:MAG: DUF4373 domain-containing protein [Bacteroidota bacterium]
MRPTRTGFETFSLPVHDAESLRFIEAKHGLTGFAVTIKLFQLTYAQGGYLPWNERSRYLHAKQIGLPLDQLVPILTDLLQEGIFSGELFKNQAVISSYAIQQAALQLARRRKDFAIPAAYCLSEGEPPMSSETPVIDGNNSPSPYMCDSDLLLDKKNTQTHKYTPTHTPRPKLESRQEETPPRSANPPQARANRFDLRQFCELYGCHPFPRLRQVWQQLSPQDHQAIGQHLPQYLKFNPKLRYRKRPINYLNPQHRFWEEPPVDRRPKQSSVEEDRIMVFRV